MDKLIIKGNLLVKKLTIVNGGGNVYSYTDIENLACDNAIVIDGDVTIDGDLLTRVPIYVTGGVSCTSQRDGGE